MKKSSREINVFSVSALDLFASALGAFIVMSMIFMVFFTMTSQSASQQENLQPALEQCEAQRAQAEGALAECQAQVENSVDASALAQCESQLAQCQDQLGGSVDASALAQCQADLAAASSAAGEMEAVNAELESCQRALKKTFVLVIASWKEDRGDDVDLHVVDPAGREFYWNDRTLAGSAAALEEDNTHGPGNEVWVHPNGEAGRYRICYKFYNDRDDRRYCDEYEEYEECPKPNVRGSIFWQEGKIELDPISLTDEKDVLLAAEFLVSEEGTVSIDRSSAGRFLGTGGCR